MPERAIRFAHQPRQLSLRNAVADERADHLKRRFGIGLAGESGDALRRKPGPNLRHIEAAVAGKPREGDIHEAERGSLAAGGNVAHWRPLSGGRKRCWRPYADGLRFTRN